MQYRSLMLATIFDGVILNEVKDPRISPVPPQTRPEAEPVNVPSSVQQRLQPLLTQYNIPTHFTREHDFILLAAPFSPLDTPASWTPPHWDLLAHVLRRHFVHSAHALHETLHATLEACATPSLSHRLTTSEAPPIPAASILLTCAPKAHLALTLVLEEHALFTVESIGRVVAAPLH